MDDRVRHSHLVTAIEDESLIRTRLHALVGGHPELATLIKTIPQDCSITFEFLTAYFRSNVKGAFPRELHNALKVRGRVLLFKKRFAIFQQPAMPRKFICHPPDTETNGDF